MTIRIGEMDLDLRSGEYGIMLIEMKYKICEEV